MCMGFNHSYISNISWEEFNTNPLNRVNTKYQVTNIKCPHCDTLLYMDTSVVLTSYPAQYIYICPNCNWRGTSYNAWK